MSDRERWLEENGLPESRIEPARTSEVASHTSSRRQGELDDTEDSQDSTRVIEAATELIALRQELDVVRRMLDEKERIVDTTAAQCRRLEDALEDQHLANDELKQDVERIKQSLSMAREQVARVSTERQAIEERYEALLAAGDKGKRKDSAKNSGTRLSPSATRFIGGLVAGIVLTILVLGVWIQLKPLSFPSAHLLAEQKAPPPTPQVKADAPGKASTTASDDAETTSPVAAPPVAAEEQPKPPVLRTRRDVLGDGSTGPLMVLLQGGDFSMGRALLNTDESPPHNVHLDSFFISTTEVTFEQYDRFARATRRRLPSDFGWGRGNRPVVDVSWDDARAYAMWLSKVTGHKYRLPSESEWEYAAGARQDSFFWWGSYPGRGRAVCLDCGTIWDARSSAPVGSFKPNPFGLYDTAGNVTEWVTDCYHPNYVGAPSDGRPWDNIDCRERVARGGAFNKPARAMHTTARQHYAPDTRINALGFRLVRDLD